jgi:hypothetical protein
MTKKPQSDKEILARLDASLAEDVLTDEFSDDDVAAALRAAGGDPVAIGRRGAALAAELLEQRRLSWQDKARKKIARAQPLFSPRADYSGLGKPELLSLYNQAKTNPRLSKPMSQLFHKRKPEDISVDELCKLLLEVDALALLDEAAEGDDPDKK